LINCFKGLYNEIKEVISEIIPITEKIKTYSRSFSKKSKGIIKSNEI